MLPEETQVEDSFISVMLLMLQLCQNFFWHWVPFFWFEHLPPKMSVHVPARIHVFMNTRYKGSLNII